MNAGCGGQVRCHLARCRDVLSPYAGDMFAPQETSRGGETWWPSCKSRSPFRRPRSVHLHAQTHLTYRFCTPASWHSGTGVGRRLSLPVSPFVPRRSPRVARDASPLSPTSSCSQYAPAERPEVHFNSPASPDPAHRSGTRPRPASESAPARPRRACPKSSRIVSSACEQNILRVREYSTRPGHPPPRPPYQAAQPSPLPRAISIFALDPEYSLIPVERVQAVADADT